MIVHLITNLTARAGAERMLARLLQQDRSEEVRVVSLMQISDEYRALLDGLGIRHESLNASSPVALAAAVWRLSKILDRDRPEIVVCWMYHAMAAGVLARGISRRKPKVVWNVRQSLDDTGSLTRSSRMAIALCKVLSARADGTIYNSGRARGQHGDHGFANRNAVVIPNGFQLPPEPVIRPVEPRRFGIAGRLHPQKDHANFFKALAIARERQPGIVGIAAGKDVSRDNPDVVAMLNGADDCVSLLGEVSDMPGFYADIDVFVLSSRTEGFPNVVAEAMSYGKPVIATDVGDAAEIVGTTGRIVPPRDSDALADAIVDFTQIGAAEYAKRAADARRRIEDNYVIADVARRYDRYFDAILGRAPGDTSPPPG